MNDNDILVFLPMILFYGGLIAFAIYRIHRRNSDHYPAGWGRVSRTLEKLKKRGELIGFEQDPQFSGNDVRRILLYTDKCSKRVTFTIQMDGRQAAHVAGGSRVLLEVDKNRHNLQIRQEDVKESTFERNTAEWLTQIIPAGECNYTWVLRKNRGGELSLKEEAGQRRRNKQIMDKGLSYVDLTAINKFERDFKTVFSKYGIRIFFHGGVEGFCISMPDKYFVQLDNVFMSRRNNEVLTEIKEQEALALINGLMQIEDFMPKDPYRFRISMEDLDELYPGSVKEKNDIQSFEETGIYTIGQASEEDDFVRRAMIELGSGTRNSDVYVYLDGRQYACSSGTKYAVIALDSRSHKLQAARKIYDASRLSSAEILSKLVEIPADPWNYSCRAEMKEWLIYGPGKIILRENKKQKKRNRVLSRKGLHYENLMDYPGFSYGFSLWSDKYGVRIYKNKNDVTVQIPQADTH